MDMDIRNRSDRSPCVGPEPWKKWAVNLALIAIALILAISFFYLTSEKRRDRPAESVTQAAALVDKAARAAGDAARATAVDMRNRN